MYEFIKKIVKSKNVFVLNELNLGGGASTSIKNVYLHSLSDTNDIYIISLDKKKSNLKLFIAALFAPKILFNGLFCFTNIMALFTIIIRTDVEFYTHESREYYMSFKKNNPIRFKIFCKWINKTKLLYASTWQKNNLSDIINPKKYKTIFENIGINIKAYNFYNSHLNANCNVGMAGFLQKRKGIDLFNLVAEYSFEQNLRFNFIWIGGASTNERITISKHVNHIGYVDSTMIFISKLDILFLTSFADPFPLVLLEALFLKKKILCSCETGFYTELTNITGIRFFSPTDPPENILLQLNLLLTDNIDEAKYDAAIRKYCLVDEFGKRIGYHG